jgi:hypothetical protein
MDAKPPATLNVNRWLALLCAIVAAIGVTWQAWDMFGPTRRPMLQGWDDSFYYFWLPSAVIDHDLDFTNQLAISGTIDPATRDLALTLPRTRTGLLESKYPPGWALGSLPFFLAAHSFAPPKATGFEPGYLVAVWLGQLLYAAIGLWLAIKLAARSFGIRIATLAVLTVWLASPLVYYQSARLSMSHSQVFTLAVAVFWFALKIWDGDSRTRNWVLLGLTAALLVVTRNAAFVYLVLPAFVILRKLRTVRAALALLAGAVVPVSVQLIAWKVIFGSWLAYSYGGERLDFSHLHLAEVLFSPRHGWFYWHPLLFISVVSFCVWGRKRMEGQLWCVSLVAIILFDAAWPTWWLGSSFGHRGFEAATFFAMMGFASLLNFARPRPVWRRGLAAVATLAVGWNIMLFGLFLTQRIPREDAVTYRDSARALVGWVCSPH